RLLLALDRLSAEDAARRRRERRVDRPVLEEREDRIAEPALLGVRLPAARRALVERVLIVDGAAIPERPFRIEDEDLRRALRAEHVGDLMALVLQDRKTDSMLLDERADLLDVIVGVRVESKERDAAGAKLLRKLLEPRRVEFRDGTSDSAQRDDDRTRIGEARKPMDGSFAVAKLEIGNGAADLDPARRRNGIRLACDVGRVHGPSRSEAKHDSDAHACEREARGKCHPTIVRIPLRGWSRHHWPATP